MVLKWDHMYGMEYDMINDEWIIQCYDVATKEKHTIALKEDNMKEFVRTGTMMITEECNGKVH